MIERLIERLNAMRENLFDASVGNHLVNLPSAKSQRVITLKGSARNLRDRLASGHILEFGKEILPHEPTDDPLKVVHEIWERDTRLQDEQGLSSIFVGLGVVSWAHDSTGERLFAPLGLRRVRVIVDSNVLALQSDGTADELNDVLLSKLGIARDKLPADPLKDPWVDTDGRLIHVEDQAVLGLFRLARKAMADRLDYEADPRLLEHGTLRRLILAEPTEGRAAPEHPSAAWSGGLSSSNLYAGQCDTFQDRAITLARSGQPAVLIQGPPGTGKSQTIVNILASGIADGRAMLVLAERASAIQVVWSRLREAGYSDKVFLLHNDGLTRGSVAEQLGLDSASTVDEVLKTNPDAIRQRIILASPETYASLIPQSWQFDMLIIDEASQMPLSSAVAAIVASNQIIVCGDSQQMQPSALIDSLFGLEADEDQPISVLTAAERAGFTACLLERHYRSRHPSLIDVSNRLFYDTRLKTVPPRRASDDLGLQLRRIQGIYDPHARTNVLEAKAVVEAIREFFLMSPTSKSLCVIAMNDNQRRLIERLLLDDAQLSDVQSQRRGLVRSVTGVQGEEWDVVYVSLTYGRTETGEVHERFGLISAHGGEKCMNVIMTRARTQTVIFSSVDHTELPISTSKGTETLRFYLRATQNGHQSLAGVPWQGPLAKSLRAWGYSIDRFGQALRVEYRRGSEREGAPAYIGIIYLTGGVHILDMESEIKQLREASWMVTEFPEQLANDAKVGDLPEFRKLTGIFQQMIARA
jgi:hypothetical protein